MNKHADIIVTYNRKALLEENIKALLAQSFAEHDIFIIDNASTDGTAELVKSFSDDRIHYYNTEKNLGGAGGFAYGLKIVIEQGYEFAWIMDDDSIPETDALASLVNKAEILENKFSFLASLVYWTDGKIFPMNAPYYKWKTVVDVQYDMVRRNKLVHIKTCSFVGCFVNLAVAKKNALPIAEFFIYGDDVEYTGRLSKCADAYLDLDSVIIHKAPSNKGADVVTAECDRIDRFYYQSRNGMYIGRKNRAVISRLVLVMKRLIKILLYSKDNKCKRIWVLIKGTLAGVIFDPGLQYADERNEI